MGKNLKGKELGKGICQRKDGSYSARFVDKYGKRREKIFSSHKEAKNWIEDARYTDKHGIAPAVSDMTVDKWFEFWTTHIICDLSPNTLRHTYATRAIERGVQPKVV